MIPVLTNFWFLNASPFGEVSRSQKGDDRESHYFVRFSYAYCFEICRFLKWEQKSNSHWMLKRCFFLKWYYTVEQNCVLPDVLTQSFENWPRIRQEWESLFPKLGKHGLYFVMVVLMISRASCCLIWFSLHVRILIKFLLLGGLPERVAKTPSLEVFRARLGNNMIHLTYCWQQWTWSRWLHQTSSEIPFNEYFHFSWQYHFFV